VFELRIVSQPVDHLVVNGRCPGIEPVETQMSVRAADPFSCADYAVRSTVPLYSCAWYWISVRATVFLDVFSF
jgi:hypothetical protein